MTTPRGRKKGPREWTGKLDYSVPAMFRCESERAKRHAKVGGPQKAAGG